MAHSNATSGFADPVHESQAVFRAVLEALSRPGIARAAPVRIAPPAPLPPLLAAVALTLLDRDVTAWLSPALSIPSVRDYLTFHTGARFASEPQSAGFVLCASPAEIPPLDSLAQGTPDYPDRSATVIVAGAQAQAQKMAIAQAMAMAAQATLSGPGLEHPLLVSLPGFGAALWRRLQANRAAYPLGVDTIVCTSGGVIGLPRSTTIEVA